MTHKAELVIANADTVIKHTFSALANSLRNTQGYNRTTVRPTICVRPAGHLGGYCGEFSLF